jgi:DNA repair and recombination protein RAD54B
VYPRNNLRIYLMLSILLFRIGMSSSKQAYGPLQEGATFSVGGKDIEVERSVRKEEFMSGACFGNTTDSAAGSSIHSRSTGLAKQFVPLMPKSTVNSMSAHCVPASGKHNVHSPPVVNTARISTSKGTGHGADGSESYWTVNWQVS